MRKRILVLAVFCITAVLAACGHTQTQSTHHKLTVVTSLRVYQEAATEVLGTHGTATAIISNPNVDPHDFEATTATGKLVADADLVISNGLGYDDWLDKLADAANPDAATLSVATDVLHRQDGDNEHVFYDPTMMPALVQKLVKRFSQMDPKHKAAYQRNGAAYLKTLAPLTRLIKQLKNSGKQQIAASSEPVFDYGLKAAGYQLIDSAFAKSIEDGTDPTPKELTQLKRDLRSGKIDVFVNNEQSDSTIVNQVVTVAKKAGVTIVNVRETQPRGQTYVQWMMHNYKQLRDAQQ